MSGRLVIQRLLFTLVLCERLERSMCEHKLAPAAFKIFANHWIFSGQAEFFSIFDIGLLMYRQ
jgi:hypothetical protein